MAQLDLTQAAQQAALDPEALPKLDPVEAELARETWRGRMLNEHVSARVFAGLLPQLMRAGVSAERQAACADMIADELRHARLCAAVVLALGGEPVADLPELEPVPEHADCEPVEALLRNVLSISCLSETVAVSLIEAERQQIEPPAVAAILRQILADEVAHARFGWTLVQELAPRLSPACRERLGDYLAVAFAHLERHELAHLGLGPEPSVEAASVGVCHGAEARSLFYDTVTQVIVPRLEAHGLAAARAWRERTVHA